MNKNELLKLKNGLHKISDSFPCTAQCKDCITCMKVPNEQFTCMFLILYSRIDKAIKEQEALKNEL